MHTKWILLAAALIGALVRAIKSDGASSLLTRIAVFFGRDESLPPVKIHTRALPFVALALGAAGAVLDARLDGAAWGVAAEHALYAVGLAVLGHELGSGIPGVKKVLQVGVVVGSLKLLTACTPGARSAFAETMTDMALCALANMNLPNDQLLLKCGAKTLEDRERLLRIVGEGRAAAAQEAVAAADRARDEAERAAQAGKVGACSDSGVRKP